MIWKPTLSLAALGAMALVSAGLLTMARADAADQLQPAPQPPEKQKEGAATGAATAPGAGQYRFLNDGNWEDPSQCAVRFGYWGTYTAGSPVKVGEYQDLGASPFYDVDGIRSDGKRTLNYTVTGTDAETNAVNMNFYRPGIQANVDYQRFPHQRLHENLGEFPNFNVTGAQQFRRQDVNPGEDYAIRVQELKANFKWQVNETAKVRLDVWGMKKEGERQASAVQECYAHNSGLVPDATPGKNCHVLSQMQHIDWQTTEVKPVIEFNFGAIAAEYSHPIRVFSQGDNVVTRLYDSGGSATSEFGQPRYMEYGVVPENITQIDQLKLSANLNDFNKVYSFLFAGNTRKESDIVPPVSSVGASFVQPESDERIGNRQFDGADVRWTNTSIDNVTITTYGRTMSENNEPAAFLIPGEETRTGLVGGTSVPIEDAPTEITPIFYQRSQFGSKALWRPWGRGFGLGGLAINGGYEYGVIHRKGLVVSGGVTEVGDDPANVVHVVEAVEDETRSHKLWIGPSVRWSPELDTYVRYKWTNTQNPLFCGNAHEDANFTTVALNSALPTHDDLIEIGGTLMPSDRFMLTGWFGIDIQSQNIGEAIVQNEPGKATVTNLNAPAGFDSQSFPFGVNGTYRATDKWTINGGVAYYTEFTDRDVAFGAGEDHTFTPYGLLQNQWSYVSRASVFNLGSSYDLTCKVRLVGQAEYVKGLQAAQQIAGDPRFPALDSTLAGIPNNFRQEVYSTRLTAGVDYQMSRRWSAYVRYVLYNYQDSADEARIAASTQPVTGLPLSGTSNMFLGGVTGMF
jgi:hypothetical protein